MLDEYAMPAATATADGLVLACMVGWFAMVWLPVALGSLRAGAWLDVSLRGRCRACAPLAHTLALLAVLLLNYVNWTVLLAAKVAKDKRFAALL